MRYPRPQCVVVVVILLAIGLFATQSECSVAVSEEKGTRQTPAVLTIGGMFPLTGRLASGGVQREAASRIAVENINAGRHALCLCTCLYCYGGCLVVVVMLLFSTLSCVRS
jgi:hypothetical protein